MYSNYNVLTLPISSDGKYQIGDTFYINRDNINYYKFLRFNNLKIKNIDYSFGVRLHFDWSEWSNNQLT